MLWVCEEGRRMEGVVYMVGKRWCVGECDLVL